MPLTVTKSFIDLRKTCKPLSWIGVTSLVLSTYRRLDDFAQIAAARLNYRLEVSKCLLRLRLDTARHDLPRGGVERNTARQEDQIADFDRLRVRPNRRGRAYTTKRQ